MGRGHGSVFGDYNTDAARAPTPPPPSKHRVYRVDASVQKGGTKLNRTYFGSTHQSLSARMKEHELKTVRLAEG